MGMRDAMSLTIATWNINSVRLRIGIVEKFLKMHSPDILCLQETKCPQGQFPSSSLKELGYGHIAEHGQKGYHGVAIVSRIPFTEQVSKVFAGKPDSRHVSVRVGNKMPVTLHNFYVPAGGDEPDPKVNEKFDHKLRFVEDMRKWSKKDIAPGKGHAIAVGDFNIAPLENDVWSHKQLLKIVSHTPVETEGLNRVIAEGKWVDVIRRHRPPEEKVYTWWSYRSPDWDKADKGRRLDHIWATPDVAASSEKIQILREARSWSQPSDHVPVIASFGLKL
jgi:exodeoxyribonuclease III